MDKKADTQMAKETSRYRTLGDLIAGDSSIINAIHLSGQDYTRLAGLGLCPGRRLEVIQSGERMIVRSGSTSIGLNSELAAAVRVH
jgi:Fe2+ transport system protein FeoA